MSKSLTDIKTPDMNVKISDLDVKIHDTAPDHQSKNLGKVSRSLEISNIHPNGNVKSQFQTVKEPSVAFINQFVTMSHQMVQSKLGKTTFFFYTNFFFLTVLPTAMICDVLMK